MPVKARKGPATAHPANPIPLEVLSESARLEWSPAHPYDPDDESDFHAFQTWVLKALAEVIEKDLGPMLPDNPTLFRTRSLQAIATLWWLNGAEAMAEDYLTAAANRATYLENNDGAGAPAMKARREFIVRREQRLVTVLAKAREAILSSVSFSQTSLNSIREDMKMFGIEHASAYGE